MPVNLATCLLKDFVYKQNEKMEYVFQDDKFVLVDRDEIADSILINLDSIFEKYLKKEDLLSIERTYDPFALNQAMCRYSRDIFGEGRLHARILHFGKKYKVQDSDMAECMNYGDYGLKVDSHSPYVHRRIACLFYWFSVLKPFRVIIKSPVTVDSPLFDSLECFNEVTVYILVQMVLVCVNYTLDVHKYLPLFRQFLYDLHYRKLSRSALEFFLNHHLRPIEVHQ